MASHNGTTESDFGLERRIEDIDLKDGDEVTNSIKIPKLKESLWDITNVLGYTGYCSNVDDINDVHGVYVDRPTMDILWQQAVRKAFKKRDYAQYTPAKAEALHFATIYQVSLLSVSLYTSSWNNQLSWLSALINLSIDE